MRPSVSSTPSRTDSPAPSATPTARTVEIESVANFRDVAGTGLALPDGGRMATGAVYRSGKLATISRADLKRLGKLGLSDVIDLRTDAVAARAPDPDVSGAKHHLVNVFAVHRTASVTFRSVSSAEAQRRRMNVDFVADRAQRRQIAKVLRLIAEADGAVLVHCTEGKDRTGWISALLQLVAGADREQVMVEYLKSNEYRKDLIDEAYRKERAAHGTAAAKVQRALLRVDRSYLNAGLAEVDRRYGGLDGYLSQGLGLPEGTLAKLRARLTGG